VLPDHLTLRFFICAVVLIPISGTVSQVQPDAGPVLVTVSLKRLWRPTATFGASLMRRWSTTVRAACCWPGVLVRYRSGQKNWIDALLFYLPFTFITAIGGPNISLTNSAVDRQWPGWTSNTTGAMDIRAGVHSKPASMIAH
jgi:hypothetical protein